MNRTNAEKIEDGTQSDGSRQIAFMLETILAPDDLAEVGRLNKEMVETRKKVQTLRTRTEMEISVLDRSKFPTPASRYWQAMREQNVQYNELVMLSYEYRKMIVEATKLDREAYAAEDELDREFSRIEAEKKRWLMQDQRRVARARIREIMHWSNIKRREMQYMTETELADPDTHQLISYTRRWINQSIQMGGGGSPAERWNLLGQLRSGILACIETGVLNEAISEFSAEVQAKIREEYGTGEILK